jgi:hypothetical protein
MKIASFRTNIGILGSNLARGIYRVVQTLVDRKHSLVLMEMFKFKPASQFLERYNSAVSSALNTEDLISNNFCKFSKR